MKLHNFFKFNIIIFLLSGHIYPTLGLNPLPNGHKFHKLRKGLHMHYNHAFSLIFPVVDVEKIFEDAFQIFGPAQYGQYDQGGRGGTLISQFQKYLRLQGF